MSSFSISFQCIRFSFFFKVERINFQKAHLICFYGKMCKFRFMKFLFSLYSLGLLERAPTARKHVGVFTKFLQNHGQGGPCSDPGDIIYVLELVLDGRQERSMGDGDYRFPNNPPFSLCAEFRGLGGWKKALVCSLFFGNFSLLSLWRG